MKIRPTLTLDMIPFEITLRKALKTPIELFLVQREYQDRVGYSIAFLNVLNGSRDILCTTYVWTDRNKALKKMFELVEFEDAVTIRVG